jgi:hypothetical protein
MLNLYRAYAELGICIWLLNWSLPKAGGLNLRCSVFDHSANNQMHSALFISPLIFLIVVSNLKTTITSPHVSIHPPSSALFYKNKNLCFNNFQQLINFHNFNSYNNFNYFDTFDIFKTFHNFYNFYNFHNFL